MQEQPKRKPQRLPHFNYAQNAAYFITICTQNRAPLFCDTVAGHIQTNHAGKMVEERLRNIANDTVTIEKHCIMPNHIHMILLVARDAIPPENTPVPQTISQMIRRFKTVTTKLYIDGVKAGRYPPFDQKIWQKSFHDHVIRNEHDYLEIWQYIDNNPLKWELDRYHTD